LGTKRIRKNRFRHKRAKLIGRSLGGGLKIIAIGVGVSLLSVFFIFCHDVFTQWEAFRVEKITLTGNRRLDREQVCEQALIQSGANIFAVNLTSARKRLLAHPWISEAYIQREIPDGIHFHIREHRAVAVIDLGRKFLLDDVGTLFKELESKDAENLPVVHGLSYADVDIDHSASRHRKSVASFDIEEKGNKRYASPYEALVTLLKIGNAIDSVIPNTLVGRIDVDRETGITIHMLEGPIVRLGFGAFPAKYAVLRRLLAYLEQGPAGDWHRVEAVDLNNLNRIVVLPYYESDSGTGLQKDTGGKVSKVS
jgi:cell division protein FtsQ